MANCIKAVFILTLQDVNECESNQKYHRYLQNEARIDGKFSSSIQYVHCHLSIIINFDERNAPFKGNWIELIDGVGC
tara:strand:- start:46 stop:276 length:231 start_codon:yes stop_codon:yes gene_type:complete